jgi:hypothetical protein
MTVFSIFTLIFIFLEPVILWVIKSKIIYDGILEILSVILWLMLVGIMFAGSREEYRDKLQFEIDSDVDSTPENTFEKVLERVPWDFEDEYMEEMDWPGYEEDFTKFSQKNKISKI